MACCHKWKCTFSRGHFYPREFNYDQFASLYPSRCLYNTFVWPVLLHNAGTWGLTGSETDKRNAFHRKQLRLLIGIKWPQRISHSNLYEWCECREISTDVMDMQWRLFGHIRLDEKAPANQAMSAYFKTDGLQGHRG